MIRSGGTSASRMDPGTNEQRAGRIARFEWIATCDIGGLTVSQPSQYHGARAVGCRPFHLFSAVIPPDGLRSWRRGPAKWTCGLPLGRLRAGSQTLELRKSGEKIRLARTAALSRLL